MEYNIWVILFDLLFTVLVYMGAPLIFFGNTVYARYKIEYKNFRKILILNSILGFGIFFVIDILLETNVETISFIPPFTYFYINKWIWQYKITNKVKKIDDGSNAINDNYDKLKELKELLDNEIITKEEFEKEKKKILK